jgi:probable rRNA maturation factor
MDIDLLTEDDAWLALPEREALVRRAADAVFRVLETPEPDCNLTVLFTSDAAMAALNRAWRGKAGATNILSFPAAIGVHPGQPRALGDLVLAAGVVAAEAASQAKPLANHTAHLIIHGLLHLLGHDHADEASGEAMERLEVRAMARLGLPDPYEDASATGRPCPHPALLDER